MNASNPRLTHPGVQRNIPWLCCCSEHLPSPVPLLELGLFFFLTLPNPGGFVPSVRRQRKARDRCCWEQLPELAAVNQLCSGTRLVLPVLAGGTDGELPEKPPAVCQDNQQLRRFDPFSPKHGFPPVRIYSAGGAAWLAGLKKEPQAEQHHGD